MRFKSRIFVCFLALILLASLPACRSHGIDVTIQNNAKTPMHNVELDYPGAAFGTPNIAAGRSYWYHIKPIDDGQAAISFEEENGKMFRQKGPAIRAGQSGRLIVIVEQNASGEWTVRWQGS